MRQWNRAFAPLLICATLFSGGVSYVMGACNSCKNMVDCSESCHKVTMGQPPGPQIVAYEKTEGQSYLGCVDNPNGFNCELQTTSFVCGTVETHLSSDCSDSSPSTGDANRCEATASSETCD